MRHDHDQLNDLVNQANEAWQRDDWAAAAAGFEQVLALAPDHPESHIWWYDAALAYKFLRNWPKAFELGKQAAARARGERDEPAFWNLGIAATILREWEVARYAWRGYGIPIESQEGPVMENFGSTCVRIKTESGEEVVWAQRLCPTRARVLNVPFDPSRRFGEVVVHDGAPNGERVSGGRAYPVFDELVLFEPSPIATLSVTINARTEEDSQTLVDAFQDRDFGADIVSSAVILCACCSEGTISQERRRHGDGELTAYVAAPEPAAVEILDGWRAASPDSRDWTDLQLA